MKLVYWLLKALSRKKKWALAVAFLPPVWLVGMIVMFAVGAWKLIHLRTDAELERTLAATMIDGSPLWPLLFYWRVLAVPRP